MLVLETLTWLTVGFGIGVGLRLTVEFVNNQIEKRNK
jgi:hypothetical protein